MNTDFVSAMDTDYLPSAIGPLLPYYPQSPPHLPLDTALYPQVVRDLLARQQGPQALDRGALVIGRGKKALDRTAPGASSLSIAPCNDAQPTADDAGDPKPQARSAPAPTLAKSRRKYTRADRAKIRILHRHGKTVAEIAALVGAPPGTVRNITSNQRRKLEDDVAEDYEYVDEEFRGKYPQTVVVDASNKRTKSPDAGAQHGREESPLTPLSSPEPEVPLMLALRAKKRKRRAEAVTSPAGDADSQSTAHQSGGGEREAAAVTDSRPIEGVRAPSTQCSTRSWVLRNVRETDTPDFAHDFLANLDFELSAYHPALLACDLGRAQDVVPLRGWRAERLHLALEKAVPQLRVAERTA
ncbi:hypothetical protein K523DRAFT_112976 [Schizophyllum commune Tattone D]|nr:hypothetical protein K523DRAFT_112976 [Schizophyllum commune Tattone D]